jgi:hypothetical protein
LISTCATFPPGSNRVAAMGRIDRTRPAMNDVPDDRINCCISEIRNSAVARIISRGRIATIESAQMRPARPESSIKH